MSDFDSQEAPTRNTPPEVTDATEVPSALIAQVTATPQVTVSPAVAASLEAIDATAEPSALVVEVTASPEVEATATPEAEVTASPETTVPPAVAASPEAIDATEEPSAIIVEVTASPKTTTPPEPTASPGSGDEKTFRGLALSDNVQRAIEKSGYETPTEVQAQIIPLMLDGRDVLAQSQTGTGKTAAFALPILSRIDVTQRRPQVLVLAPTRELAIQVADSFSTYAGCLDGFQVATIYGGQSYDPQLRQLRRGAQVVVGTPGRVIDHLRRGTLDISAIDCLVLDEADEMLNMGFLEDVQFVLQQTPETRQVALFSATLPAPIKAIAKRYLSDPATVTVKKKTMTADSIRQRALFVAPRDKIHALCRILEAEETDGVIVFTKTKAATLTVAESLCREGLSAVALNGDMPQATRERTVGQFKSGRLDILVATDVAARGLDVSRVSHVFNFDLPHDTESYIHRVGRTGRAGRNGEAIIFLAHAQRGRLRVIEKVTKQRIEVIQLPTTQAVNDLRIKRFKDQITKVTAEKDLTMFKNLIAAYAAETDKPVEIVAAALAHIAQQGRPFLAVEPAKRKPRDRKERRNEQRQGRNGRNDFADRGGQEGYRKPRRLGPPESGMVRFRIEVGRNDGVKPGNIVGALANEAGIDGEFIGPIVILDDHSTVDLPDGMPDGIFQSLRRTWVVGKQLQLARASETGGDPRPSRKNRKNSKPHGKHAGGGKTFARKKTNSAGKHKKKKPASA